MNTNAILNPMVFNSMEFIFLFLPISVLVNSVLPKHFRTYWLLAVSLIFLAYGNIPTFIIILVYTFTGYTLALKIDEVRDRKVLCRFFLLLTIVLNMSLLFVYKYMNYATSLLQNIFTNIKVSEYVLPLGISFIAFQTTSYIIDVYRGASPERNIFRFALYISFFPQVLQGPIVRYDNIKQQLVCQDCCLENFQRGFYRFLIGLNKKVLLADSLSKIVDVAFSGEVSSVALAWGGAIAYSLQLYFDFCGYTDMALGLGKMFGFSLPENFDYPYISGTVGEFWRRWHITLGQWFRDYLYFPLGGSRKGKYRTVFNLFIVWLATGIWHGANVTFLIWGLLHCVVISAEKLLSIPKKIKNSTLLRICWRLVTALTVLLGWVIFRSETLAKASRYILIMFGFIPKDFLNAEAIRYLREYSAYFLVGILLSTPVIQTIKAKVFSGEKHSEVYDISAFILQFLLAVASVSFLIISSHNPFVYFNF